MTTGIAQKSYKAAKLYFQCGPLKKDIRKLRN